MAKAMAKYREMSVEELLDQVDQLRTELFNLRVGNTTKELQNTAKIRMARRELARTLTALGARQQA
jgi:large subunit ribosomal protein L29